MPKLVTLFLSAALLTMAGCAPKHVLKTWEAATGSRADATVTVGFVYNPALEIPEQSEAQAREVATKRCQAWGYADAESFGMSENRCQHFINAPFGGMQCTSMLVSRTYQCLGQNNVNVSSTPASNKPGK